MNDAPVILAVGVAGTGNQKQETGNSELENQPRTCPTPAERRQIRFCYRYPQLPTSLGSRFTSQASPQCKHWKSNFKFKAREQPLLQRFPTQASDTYQWSYRI
ncbi:MAG: hypothetical protein GY924_04285 [Planctomycetaceae bacterium]|nr:hypothetical protein [Planctomycetaceae bacterium]